MAGTGRLIRTVAGSCENRHMTGTQARFSGMGMLPGPFDQRAERLGGPIFTAVGLALLAVCTILAALGASGPQWTATLVIAGVTALWLPLLIPLFPRRADRPWLVVTYYAGVLAAALVLLAHNDVFTAFVSIGYPFAFALFPARWSMFPVAATAILPMVVKGGQTPAWIIVLSVAGPLLYAGWFIGTESEKRRKANAQLASANARLEAALEENAGLHAQLLTQAREAGKLDERQRMAREIHDTLAQGLTGIVTQLQAADRADGSERRRHLANVHTLAKTSLTEARRAVEALRPEPLAESHLPEAMAELARRFAETSTSKCVPKPPAIPGRYCPNSRSLSTAWHRKPWPTRENTPARPASASHCPIRTMWCCWTSATTASASPPGNRGARTGTASDSRRCASASAGWRAPWKSKARQGKAPRSARRSRRSPRNRPSPCRPFCGTMVPGSGGTGEKSIKRRSVLRAPTLLPLPAGHPDATGS